MAAALVSRERTERLLEVIHNRAGRNLQLSQQRMWGAVLEDHVRNMF